jgi:4-hydroxy-tetrahydrodipicolinate synthase
MIDCFIDGDARKAAQIHRNLLPLVNSLFVVANPMPVKYALNYLGFTVGTPRLPLTEPDEKVKALIQETLKCYKIDLPIANKPR